MSGLWWEDAERAASYDPRHDYDPDVDDVPDAQDLAELHEDIERRMRLTAARERAERNAA